ncbi:putative n-6 adenine-specific dna methyltransferase 2 [Diaporthe ampelina]|uniref:Protein-lysine N-methyltransferase EFM5 n=1 Tax=Diaporthe ampelina TaxID=1214573 RepID=A0A0G2HN48_9PEZI|nr:putative n-6 adenine-specific dna methyltransferase 2 [Diaporthe ampelina]
MADSDDEPITLSAHALDALQEFYSDRDARARQFEELRAAAEERTAAGREKEAALVYPLSMETFGEDWNESQFWYSDETADLLARQLLDGATSETSVAVVSAPSVFVALKNILHDYRFGVFSEFHFYDFMQPVKLPASLKGSVDRIICDPPFLSDDCQTKAALTVRWMAKPAPDVRLIVSTGERMENLVTKLYRSFGIKTTDYEPAHARGLSNEFFCYANFDSELWKWRPDIKDR